MEFVISEEELKLKLGVKFKDKQKIEEIQELIKKKRKKVVDKNNSDKKQLNELSNELIFGSYNSIDEVCKLNN